MSFGPCVGDRVRHPRLGFGSTSLGPNRSLPEGYQVRYALFRGKALSGSNAAACISTDGCKLRLSAASS